MRDRKAGGGGKEGRWARGGRETESEREKNRKMVCVLLASAGVCWAGINGKMQPWGIQAAPLLCAVRHFGHAFNLGWGVMGHEPLPDFRMCVCVCICLAECLTVLLACVPICTVVLCV